MNEQPLVTVITLIYNTGPYVIQALKSVRSQTYKNIEHILLDDCSSDNSVEMVQRWIQQNNYPCSFLKHDKNKGVCASLNDALATANGKYVNFVSDDLFFPTKIENQVNKFESLPLEYCLVYGDLQVITEKNEVTYPSFYSWYMPNIDPPSGEVFRYYLDRNPMHFLGALLRRDVFSSVGYFDEALVYEDWDMGMRMARKFKFWYVPEIVGAYRKFDGQMTDVYWTDEKKLKRIFESDFKMFSKHLDLPHYRKQLVAKLSAIFEEQINRNFLSWKDQIKYSSFLVRYDLLKLRHWVLFAGSLINQAKSALLLFKKVIFKLNQWISPNQYAK